MTTSINSLSSFSKNSLLGKFFILRRFLEMNKLVLFANAFSFSSRSLYLYWIAFSLGLGFWCIQSSMSMRPTLFNARFLLSSFFLSSFFVTLLFVELFWSLYMASMMTSLRPLSSNSAWITPVTPLVPVDSGFFPSFLFWMRCCLHSLSSCSSIYLERLIT